MIIIIIIIMMTQEGRKMFERQKGGKGEIERRIDGG